MVAAVVATAVVEGLGGVLVRLGIMREQWAGCSGRRSIVAWEDMMG